MDGHVEVARLLLDHGAQVSIGDCQWKLGVGCWQCANLQSCSMTYMSRANVRKIVYLQSCNMTYARANVRKSGNLQSNMTYGKESYPITKSIPCKL